MMVELDVDSHNDVPVDLFDGQAELNKWYNAPTLSIFSRIKKPPLRDYNNMMDLNPEEWKPRVDDIAWVEDGLKIIEERKSNNSKKLIYSSPS